MGARIGIMELLLIVILGFLLLGITLVLFLRRRRPGAGFPVAPPESPSEADRPWRERS